MRLALPPTPCPRPALALASPRFPSPSTEYRTRVITKMCGGNPYVGAYSLALVIFVASLGRTWQINAALVASQGSLALPLPALLVDLLAYLVAAVGAVLVLGAYYRLGILHTYLADYFGLLMSARVTGFPYSVLDHPMYTGSTLLYLADALFYRSLPGLLLVAIVWLVYEIASNYFEGPFTAYIYAEAAKQKQRASK